MPSFQITISPKDRVAGRFVSLVRRTIQKALAEESAKRGLTQSDLARSIGVNRSVVSREIRGHKDLTLSRVAELAWALGRKPVFDLQEVVPAATANHFSEMVTTAAPAPGTLNVGTGTPDLVKGLAASSDNRVAA